MEAYQAEGVRGIRSPTRGRKPGEQSTLSPRQEKQIQDLIRDKTSDQYKLGLRSRRGSTPYIPAGVSFAPWTRQAVQKLIRLRLNRTMPPRTMGETLKRWGFTPRKPLKRAYLPAAGKRISELRFEGGCTFKASGQKPQFIGK